MVSKTQSIGLSKYDSDVQVFRLLKLNMASKHLICVEQVSVFGVSYMSGEHQYVIVSSRDTVFTLKSHAS